MFKPKYIKCSNFTGVFTPHFLEQCEMRRNLLGDLEVTVDFLERIYKNTAEDETTGAKLGNGYVYSRKKFNRRRWRWELELISFTPSDFLQTRNRQFARRIDI